MENDACNALNRSLKSSILSIQLVQEVAKEYNFMLVGARKGQEFCGTSYVSQSIYLGLSYFLITLI